MKREEWINTLTDMATKAEKDEEILLAAVLHTISGAYINGDLAPIGEYCFLFSKKMVEEFGKGKGK